MRPTLARTLVWCLPALGLLGLAGCGDDESAATDSGGSDGAGSTASTAGGAAVYEANCASCHGSDLRGTDRGPSHLSQVYEPGHHGDDAFRAAIANGSRAHHWDFGDMPPVPGLSDEEVDAVIAFVRAQQEQHGFEPYPPG